MKRGKKVREIKEIKKEEKEKIKEIRSKKDLELWLECLRDFEEPSWELEQYATPAVIAADWLWQAALKGDLRGKVILDGACGPGILGIGSLLMGAKKVFFIDKSREAIELCRENYERIKEKIKRIEKREKREKGRRLGEGVFILGDIRLFDEKVEVVLENPPFGTKERHIDKVFLEKAFELGKVVWSMHKLSTKRFVEAVSSDYNFEITDFFRYDFPIKAKFKWHEKPVKKIEVGLWRMERIIEER